MINDATPTILPADGSSTADVAFSVIDAKGFGVSDDQVHFGVGVQSGTGQCGTLSSTEQTTNDNGDARVT